MKSEIIKPMLFTLTGAIAACSSAEKTAQKEKPNVLFILVDDIGWTDVGCFGSSFYETPNLDKLANEGVKFTNAYASCPVCSPTRASIMTGKNTVNHGVTDWIPGRQDRYPKEDHRKFMALPFNLKMELDEITLAEAMKEAGYITHFAGKWHLGDTSHYPEQQGFDYNIGGTHRGGPYGGGGYFYPFGPPVEGDTGDFLTDKLTDYTIDFIEKYKDTTFFAYLSFYTLHNPIMAPDSLVEKYKKKADKLGYTDDERFTQDRKWIQNLPPPKWNDYKLRLVQDNPVYAAMVEIMDNNVGKLMNALKNMKIDKNTIIIFTGDNGGLSTSEGSNTCNLPLRGGKGWLYEGGIREPTIIKWPGQPANGSTSGALVNSYDYYPTILGMAGIPLKPEQHTDGMSLVPVLKGNKQKERMLVWHYPHYSNQGAGPGTAIRMGDYKLIDWFEKEQLELYNLKNDIGEQHNLADEMPDKCEEMFRMMDKWRKENNAKMMKPNRDYEPYQRK